MTVPLSNPFVVQNENISSQYCFILDSLPACVCYIDKNLCFQYINKAYENWIGLSSGFVSGKTLSQILGNDSFERLKEYSEKALSGKTVQFEAEIPYQKRIRFIEATYTPDIDESGLAKGYIALIKDITEKKKIEQEQKLKSKQQDYFNNAAICIHWVDANGIILWANKAELNMLGYTEEEYIGHNITEFHEDKNTVNDILGRLLQNETLNQYESVLKCKNGSLRTVRINSSGLWKDGKLIHTQCFSIDVTEQKKLFEALKENESRYRQLVNGLPAAVYTCDAQGHILMFNEAAATLWGRKPQIGKDLWCGSWRIFWPDGRPVPLDKCPMAITLKEGRPISLAEIIIERQDGVRMAALANPKPIFDASGKVVEAVNMLVDITGLKEAEKALQESEERFSKAADAAPVMIWMSDHNMQFIFFNKGWLEYRGRTQEQEAGDGWSEGVHPDDMECCISTYVEAFNKREEFKMEYRLKRHDGVYRWILNNGRPRFAPDGIFTGYIGSCIDVTDNKMMAEALEKEVELRTKELQLANQQLVRYNEELEQFAYAASHDLQEPLRKIQTFAGMLAERNYNELNDAGKNYVSKIIKSTERMSGIIDDLLAYSRQTKIDELIEETDLTEIVNNVLSDLELLIHQKKAQVVCDALPHIKAIPSQMNRLFYNLINNSLKFSQPGIPPVIQISVQNHLVTEDLQHLPFLELSIKDNGIGFEQKDAGRIFQLFQRLNDKYSFHGNGIGLALCKKIVQNHNGEIFAESAVNAGAVFHIKFPSRILVAENTVLAR